MPNPLNINDAADLVDVAIQDIWLKGSERQTFYNQYFNVETGVQDYYLKDSSLSGLGLAGRVVENAAVTSQSPVQGFDKTYTQVQFGVILPFTKHMWMFGIKKRNLENVVEEAKKTIEDKRETLCADHLDNAWDTTYSVNDISGNYTRTITGGDGLSLIGTSHTREDGGAAWVNEITDGTTVNMDFEYDALKAAVRTASRIRGPTGKPLNVSPDTLVVARGYAPHLRALEILGAVNKGFIAGSADHDGAGVSAYKVIALPWITTNTAYWFMFDSSMKNNRYGLQYKESQPITLEGPNKVFKTGEIQYKATAFFDLGFNDGRNIIGSKNTNAT